MKCINSNYLNMCLLLLSLITLGAKADFSREVRSYNDEISWNSPEESGISFENHFDNFGCCQEMLSGITTYLDPFLVSGDPKSIYTTWPEPFEDVLHDDWSIFQCSYLTKEFHLADFSEDGEATYPISDDDIQWLNDMAHEIESKISFFAKSFSITPHVTCYTDMLNTNSIYSNGDGWDDSEDLQLTIVCSIEIDCDY